MSEQPTPTPDDHAPTNNPDAALHWAAVAYNLAAAREARGQYLTPDEQTNFHQYQNAARSHGYTDRDVRDHAKALQGATR